MANTSTFAEYFLFERIGLEKQNRHSHQHNDTGMLERHAAIEMYKAENVYLCEWFFVLYMYLSMAVCGSVIFQSMRCVLWYMFAVTVYDDFYLLFIAPNLYAYMYGYRYCGWMNCPLPIVVVKTGKIDQFGMFQKTK